MKKIRLVMDFLLFPFLFLTNVQYITIKRIRYYSLLLLMAGFIIPSSVVAGGGNSSNCTAGEKECPKELVLDGDPITNQDTNPTQYYYFNVTKAQGIVINLTNRPSYDKTLNIKLYPLNSDGSCNTDDSPLTQGASDQEFNVAYTAEGGKQYCIEASDSSMFGKANFDIDVDGTAALEAGISDASEKEDNGPIHFLVALTKASSNDITINYTFTDGSAVNGTNYVGNNGSVTIVAGSLTTEISVDLIDTHMTTTKSFTVTISSDDVDINEESETAVGKIIGSDSEDADDNYEGPDICYESRDNSGFCMFGSCMFYQETTHVKAMVNGLENIDIKKALTRGIAFMNFFNGIGIDDTSKTQQTGDDQAEERAFADNTDFMPTSYYFASMFPKGYDYRLGNGADATNGGDMNKGDRTSYYDKALFKLGLFTQYTHIVTYTKDGVTYQEVLQPCNPDEYGSLEEAPILNECGVFLGALNSATKIKFNSSAWQTINYQDTLVTPTIEGSTGYCSQIGQVCPADQIGSNRMDLPLFRESKQDNHIEIPYSLVISEQHIGNLETTTNDTTEENEDERYIVFEAPYSSSYGKRVMFIKSITDHDNHANHYHYIFKRGDYWIENWDILKNKNVTIETTGDVRFFIKDSFSIATTGSGEIRMGYNPDEDDTASCDEPHFYMYLYDDWSISAAGSAHIKNGYIYAKGSITIGGNGAFASYYTAITADDVVTVNTIGSGAYTPGDNGVCEDDEYSGLFEECPHGAQAYETGPFDAWDTFRNVNNRFISTKITKTDFNITIASINSDNNGTEALEGKECYYRLYDKVSHKVLSDWGALSNQATKVATYSDITGAYPKVYVQFKFCQQKETTPIVLGSFNDCETNATFYEYNTSTESSDGFAIRPDRFVIEENTSMVGSGNEFTIIVHAIDPNGQDVPDYNKSVSIWGTSPSIDHNESVTGCRTGVLTKLNGIFEDGKAQIKLSYNEVGNLKLLFTEHNDTDFAHIDLDDTDFNTTTHDSTNHDGEIYRQIGSAITTRTFIPDHFQLENITLHDQHEAADINFTYLASQNVHDQINSNMVATLNLDIRAYTEQNTTTLNYNSTCGYAQMLDNIDVGYLIDTKDSNSYPQGLSKILYRWYDDGSNENTGNQNFGTKLTIPNIPSNVFNTDHNGTAKLKIQLNFNRSFNTPVNPFIFSINDINVSDHNNIIDMNDSAAPVHTATFLYARAKSSEDLYDDQESSPAKTPIMVQVYCNRFPASSAVCPNIDIVNGQTNDYSWWIARKHISNTDGNITLTTSTSGAQVISLSSSSNRVSISNGIDEAVQVSGTVPSTVEIDFATSSTDSWLIYNKFNDSIPSPFYKVRFIGNMGWAGYGKTGNVVNTNSNTKKNKRVEW